MKYYVDEIKGDDTNLGLSLSSPKKSILYVIKILKPGDEIHCLSNIHINKFSDLFPEHDILLNIYFNKHTLNINTTLTSETINNNIYLNIYQARITHNGNGDDRAFFYRNSSSSPIGITQFHFHNCIIDTNTPSLIYFSMYTPPSNFYAIFNNCTFLFNISSTNITLNNCVSNKSISGCILNNTLQNKNIDLNNFKIIDGDNKIYGIYSNDYSWCIYNKFIIHYDNKRIIQNKDGSTVDVTDLPYDKILPYFKNSINNIDYSLLDTNVFKVEFIVLRIEP